MSDQQYRVISPNGKWKLATRKQIVKASEAGKLPEGCEVLIYERIESLATFCSGFKPFVAPTEPQLNYAVNLGVDVPEGASRSDVSKLLNDATAKREEHLERLSKGESEAWQQIHREVLDEMHPNDVPLSLATLGQIVEAFENRDMAAFVMTIPIDAVADSGEKISANFGDAWEKSDLVQCLNLVSDHIAESAGIESRQQTIDKTVAVCQRSLGLTEELVEKVEGPQTEKKIRQRQRPAPKQESSLQKTKRKTKEERSAENRAIGNKVFPEGQCQICGYPLKTRVLHCYRCRPKGR